MYLVKVICYALVFFVSSYLGILFSKKYVARVEELVELKNALNVLKTKIRFTYQPIPEIFAEIANTSKKEVANLFENAKNKMKQETAGSAWKKSIEESNLSFTKEDKDVLNDLGKLLGQTDVEGQIGQIELVTTFLDQQIEKAELERKKNEKLYRTLGLITGLGIVIVLM